MKITKGHAWVALACLLLGAFIAFQYKYYAKNYVNDSSQFEKMGQELMTLRAEKTALLQEIEQLQGRLDTISNSASQESALVKNLTEDLNRIRALLGLTKLSGPGIVITLDDSSSTEGVTATRLLAYDYRMILDLVNELYAAGAEAISINEQRLTNYSEVRLAGRQLNVNFVPLSAPYVIKVIGDYDTLNGAITSRFGIIGRFREAGYYAEVSDAETIEVPAFTGVLRFIHAQVVK